jgi:hypothetical protein
MVPGILEDTTMRFLLAALLVASLAGVAEADGFTGRHLPVKDALSLLPGQEEDEGMGWGTEDWGGEPTGPPELADTVDRPRAAPRKKIDFAPDVHLGYLLPFISKGAEYSGGLAFGASGKIGLGKGFPHWLRASLDLGFTAAEDDYWEADSMLLLVHLDAGMDLVKAESMRVSAFLSLGGGFEFFSAESLVAGGEDLSETNANLLGAAGASFGYYPIPRLGIEVLLRLTFPLGGRNVQGILLAGASVSYKF